MRAQYVADIAVQKSPLQPMPPSPLPPVAGRHDATALKSPPVLVIDDDPDIREALAEVLAEEGFWVHDAADGMDALERLAQLPRPCVLLLDWRMPRLDGKGLLDKLETQGELGNLTVLVQTATPADVHDARVSRVFGKPLDLGGIFEALEGHSPFGRSS
jgi:two-component system, chemotaxis family, chemotaxis protein CheY